MIYQRPAGGRVTDVLSTRREPISEQELVRIYVKPLTEAIREYRSLGVTHRGIRPENMYFIDGAKSRVVIGDATTAPPAFDQPVIYETIEAAMCQPEGRGAGTSKNDLYALGVSILVIYNGRAPLSKASSSEIIDAKISQGSYGAMAKDERLPLPMVEVLRGLLCDDEEERWNIEAMEAWLNGRRLNPLTPKPERRAKHSFSFGGKEYQTKRALARSMYRDWENAILAMRDPRLETWIRRGFDDKEMADKIYTGFARIGVTAPDQRAADDLSLALLLMLLDPNDAGPLQGGQFLSPGLRRGAGPRGGRQVRQPSPDRAGGARSAASVVRYPRRLFARQLDHGPGPARPAPLPEKHRHRLRPGTLPVPGARRGALPEFAAQQLLRVRYRRPARGVGGGGGQCRPQGLAVRPPHRRLHRRPLPRGPRRPIAGGLTMPTRRNALLGMLSLLATIQWYAGPEKVSELTAWLASLMAPAVNAYHSRSRRKAIDKEIPKIVRKGWLPDLYNLIDNPSERIKDSEEFIEAQERYLLTEEEIKYLESDEVGRDQQTVRFGQKMAAVASIILGLLILSAYVIIKFTGGNGG